MRIAIVHDALCVSGGAERLVLWMAKAFPHAPIFTSVYLPNRTFKDYRELDVRTLPLSRFIRSERQFKLTYPLWLSLIQRVTSATVTVKGEVVGTIEAGLLALVGVEPGDGEAQIARMAERLLGYRVFADEAGRMNRSLADTGGGLLLVSQFTLAADTRSGMRPSFTTAAPPAEAEQG